MNFPKTCIVIAGPTAVGKTAFAIEIAKTFHTQIISADSRQCYRELSVGVGKPTAAQLSEVKHYFINSYSIQQEVHAGLFEQYALAAAEEIFRYNDIAVLVGGTGLYINAFCDGLDEVPLVLPDVRNGVITSYKEHGLEWLQQQVMMNDPAYFNDGEIQNPQRLMRALEVKLSTGRSIRTFHTRQKKTREFSIVKFGLELDKQILHHQINQRVDEMMENGLVEEVLRLIPFKHLTALNTVGYKEFFAYLDGQISLNEATDLVKKNTRLYAKRQMTWFKKDLCIKWIHPHNYAAVKEFIDL
ncbi:MAG: tRNA (adenosine(37)-N6)-dimethylallyltransferase MiaA [Chitinophagaceae bacterium]